MNDPPCGPIKHRRRSPERLTPWLNRPKEKSSNWERVWRDAPFLQCTFPVDLRLPPQSWYAPTFTASNISLQRLLSGFWTKPPVRIPRSLGFRERAHVWVLPSLNPDGYARTWRQAGHGQLSELRTNARGVDLNRNFPRPQHSRSIWFNFGGWRTGSDDPKNPFFRGSGAFSEPETQAIRTLCENTAFIASANLHSTMGTIIPPCVHTQSDYRQYGELIRAFARGQKRWRYRRLANRFFDRFTGEQEDYQHHAHGTWAVCVEHYPIWKQSGRFSPGKPLFWRFNPRVPSEWVENDIPGIAAYFRAALTLEAQPQKVDS